MGDMVDIPTQSYEEGADMDERMLLVRAEAEAERQKALTRGHDATPAIEYDHMPDPLRDSMTRMSQWILNKAIHLKFAAFCRCNGQKMAATEQLFESTPDVAFPIYWAQLAKCKGLEQWKARIIAINAPQEAVLAIRNLNDVGRLLGLIYFAASQPGDEMATDLRGRDFFIPEPTGAFLGF